jgi:hypothetical protein
MSNYSDVWLKDNLDETKLAILETEYALEMLPYYSSRSAALRFHWMAFRASDCFYSKA